MQSVTLHSEEEYGIVSPNKTRLMTYVGISELYKKRKSYVIQFI